MRPGAGFDPDRGAAAVLTLVWLGVVVAVAGTGMALLGLWNTHSRAQGAADLAALAGAGRVMEGAAPACRAADRVARANGARLTACRVVAADVWVTVQLPIPPGMASAALAGRTDGVSGRAHATLKPVSGG